MVSSTTNASARNCDRNEGSRKMKALLFTIVEPYSTGYVVL